MFGCKNKVWLHHAVTQVTTDFGHMTIVVHLKRQLDIIFFFSKTCGVHVAESGTLANFILVGNLLVEDLHNRLVFCTCSVIQW